jgi:hypothetical protein
LKERKIVYKDDDNPQLKNIHHFRNYNIYKNYDKSKYTKFDLDWVLDKYENSEWNFIRLYIEEQEKFISL